MNTPTQTDRAWAALSAQLDEVMPQQRRKKPFLIWLLLLGVAGLGAFMVRHQRTQLQPQPPTNQPVAVAVAPVTDFSTPVLPNANADGHPKPNSHASNTVPTRQSRVPGPHAPAMPRRLPTIAASASLLPRVPEPIVQSAAPAPDLVVLPNNPSVPSAIPTGLDPLPQHEVELRAQQHVVLMPVSNTPDIQPQRQPSHAYRLNIGGHIGWQQTVQPASGGVSAGVDWLPEGSRFGLRATPGYRLTHYPRAGGDNNVTLQGVANQDTNGNFDFEATPGNVQLSTTPDLVEASVKNRHHLELPIHVFWQPRSRLRVYAGGSAAYLLGVSAYNSVAYNNQDDLQLSSTRSLNRTLTRQEPRWQFAASAGVGYRLGKHLELTAMEQVAFLQQNKTAAANQLTPAAVLDADAGVKSTFQVGVRWIW